MTVEGRLLAIRLLIERGLTLRIYVTGSGLKEPAADYAPRVIAPSEWTWTDDGASFSYLWEFRGAAVDAAGWFLTCGEMVVHAEPFADGPYSVRRVGDRVEVTARLAP